MKLNGFLPVDTDSLVIVVVVVEGGTQNGGRCFNTSMAKYSRHTHLALHSAHESTFSTYLLKLGMNTAINRM